MGVPAAGQHEMIIGPFKLDTHRRSLSRNGVPIALGGRAFDVLMVLAVAEGQTVSKDDLLDQVWPGLAVEENNLQVQISALRKALGEGRIITVQGRGYRLVALNNASIAPAQNPPAGKPSIAVLPFVNVSGDPEQEYFADGIAEEIITTLSRIRSIFVIARNSSFTYKGRSADVRQIGRELGVRYIVEGSVRRDRSRIRIISQLVDTESGSHIWAERFDRHLEDIFAVQDEITRAIVEALAPAISHAERQRAMTRPPENLGAWEAYQRSLWHWSKQGSENRCAARALLQQAVTLDPRFGHSHAMLAWLHLSEATLGTGLSLREGVKLAEAEARTAVDLDPNNAMGHAMLAWAFDHQGQLESALDEADLAVGLNPNDPWAQMTRGRVLVYSGRSVEGREPLTTALRLDPRGPTAPTAMHFLGVGSYFERNYLGTVAMTRRAIREFPDFPRPYPVLAAALGQLGQTGEARIALDASIAASPTYFETMTGSRMPYYSHQDHEHLLDGLRKAGWRG
jgi:adenylate cyclase